MLLDLLFSFAGLSTLIGLAAVAVWLLEPEPLKKLVPNIGRAAGLTAICCFGFSFVHGSGIVQGDLAGYARGTAEVQRAWDAEKAAIAQARLAAKQKQDQVAKEQKGKDEAAAAALAGDSGRALKLIRSAPTADDGPVPKVLADELARLRARRPGP